MTTPGFSTAGFNAVAAGDPTPGSVTLWTRTYDLTDSSRRTGISQNVTLQVSKESSFSTLAYQTNGSTSASSQDATIKFNVKIGRAHV